MSPMGAVSVLFCAYLAFLSGVLVALWTGEDRRDGFWAQHAMEKDLEAHRLRSELSIQTHLCAMTRHALQRFTKLCADRHVDRPQ